MGDQELTDRFRVVFMCTGNQARSVIAEHYFRKITEGLPVQIESCGTMDTAGAPALEEAVEAARGLGLDLGGHISRPFTSTDLASADLVLGFEQHHVATAVVDGGSDPARTFRLLELARLLNGLRAPKGRDAATVRSAVAAAAAARAAGAGFVPGEDLADPAGHHARFFAATAASIKNACDDIAKLLVAPPNVREKIWD